MSSLPPGGMGTHLTVWGSKPVLCGLVAYALTSFVVILGVSFGREFVTPADPSGARGAFEEGFSGPIGKGYKTIATAGYDYNPRQASPVAYFPLFPLLGASVIALTGLGPTWALLLVSHTCLAAAFVVAAAYIRGRRLIREQNAGVFSLLAMGVMPATFFFRMTCSESTFLLLSLLFLLGLQREWPLLVVALIAGLASASRPVGVALLLPLLIYIWHRSRHLVPFLGRAAVALLLGSWGLIAYAGFLYAWFDVPWAFAQTQVHWGRPAPSLAVKAEALLSYQPIWEAFLFRPVAERSMFSWQLVNPTYFVASAVLVALGTWRRWLDAYEVSLAVMLLLIPYVTRAYEMEMGASARFAAVVFPVYLVVGGCLARLSSVISAGLLCISAFFLGAFSALFASQYQVF